MVSVLWLGPVAQTTSSRLIAPAALRKHVAKRTKVSRPDPGRVGSGMIEGGDILPYPSYYHTHAALLSAHCRTRAPKNHINIRFILLGDKGPYAGDSERPCL